MIVPDINLLLYTYDSNSPFHDRAREWWEDLLSSPTPVGLPWLVLLGFIRIRSNRRFIARPMAPAEALAHCRSWLQQPNARILVPGPRHLDILESLLGGPAIGSRLATDAHLAALAIENQAELHSNDSGFLRFSGLRWRNPVA